MEQLLEKLEAIHSHDPIDYTRPVLKRDLCALEKILAIYYWNPGDIYLWLEDLYDFLFVFIE